MNLQNRFESAFLLGRFLPFAVVSDLAFNRQRAGVAQFEQCPTEACGNARAELAASAGHA